MKTTLRAGAWILVAGALLSACELTDTEVEAIELAPAGLAIPSRPNVVVIMVDDLDVDGMNTLLELGLVPNIKHHLVDAGVVFENSFVANSQCCPSRAIFLTGQYSHNTGVHTSYSDEANGGVAALDDSSTLATWLHDAGYRTGYVGKYLNGYGKDRDSEVPQWRPTYVPPGWDHWQGLAGRGIYRSYRYQINNTVDGVTRLVPHGVGPDNYKNTILTRRSVQFIHRANRGDDDQPFFLMVNPIAPHAEGQRGRPGNFDLFLDHDPRHLLEKPTELALIAGLQPTSFAKPSFDRVDPSQPFFVSRKKALTDVNKTDLTSYYRDRLSAMLSVDDMVGALFAELEAAGELANTVVIFTSDNGYVMGERRSTGKTVAYDESIRVPLYVRIPGVAAGTVDHIVANVDLAPTIASLAQAPAGLAMDGRSMLPLLATDHPVSTRHHLLVEHWGELPRVPTYGALRTDQYLYVHYDASGARELYDLALDPYQTRSVHADLAYAATVDSLDAALVDMRSCSAGSCQKIEAR